MWSKKDTNEQLVCYLQQHHDDEAFEVLFRRFIPMYNKFYRMYKISSFTLSDYYQEGRIILYKAILNFNSERQTYFAHFYQLLSKNHIYNLLRRYASQKRCIIQKEVSYNIVPTKRNMKNFGEELNGLDFVKQTVCPDPEQWTVVREKVEDYFASLSPLEKTVFKKMMEGMTFSEVAIDLGETLERVRNAYDRCRQKLKKALKDLST